MEFVLSAGLVSTILGTASRAQNVGPLSAVAVAGYIVLGRPVVEPDHRGVDEPGPIVRPGRRLGDFAHYWVYVVGPVAGGLVAVGIAWILRGPGGDANAIAAAQGSQPAPAGREADPEESSTK